MGMEITPSGLHEFFVKGKLIAYLQTRPLYCDKGRFHANIEVSFHQSEADPWPRYYFDLERGKAEVEAYLVAKKIDIAGGKWRN
jgi:hypothetical protein